jgi:Bacterial SH3 domain
MTLRRTLTGLALCVMALTLFMGCVEPGPPPSPPPMVEPPPPPPSPPRYFVTVSGLALREGPTTSAPQIGTLEFNDEVVLLGTSSGWGRVEDVRRQRTGWASMRYLQPMPANRPQSVPRRRAPAPKEPTTPAEPPKAM